MAIITLAAPISGIRGKVGGIVYSANKSGPYLKAWGKGSNPRSAFQGDHRSALAGLSQNWKTLSVANQDTWDVYADLTAQELTNSLGETYFISGFNWFIRINLNRQSTGDAQLDTAPVSGTPAIPTIETVSAFDTESGSESSILLTSGSAGDGERMVIKGELVTSAGVIAGPAVRTFFVALEQAIGEHLYEFQSALESQFGTVQLGQKLFVSIQHQSSEGRRSAPVNGSAIVIEPPPGLFFEDTFTVSSNENINVHTPDLGTGWTIISNGGSGIIQVNATSDTVVYTDPEAGVGFFVTADASYPSADYYIECTMVKVEAGDDTTTLVLRFADTSNMYYATFSNSSIGECKIFKKVGITTTELATFSQTVANGSVVKFSISGSTLEVYDDGLLIASQNDTSHTAIGKAGFGYGLQFGSGTNDIDDQEIDNFQVFST